MCFPLWCRSLWGFDLRNQTSLKKRFNSSTAAPKMCFDSNSSLQRVWEFSPGLLLWTTHSDGWMMSALWIVICDPTSDDPAHHGDVHTHTLTPSHTCAHAWKKKNLPALLGASAGVPDIAGGLRRAGVCVTQPVFLLLHPSTCVFVYRKLLLFLTWTSLSQPYSRYISIRYLVIGRIDQAGRRHTRENYGKH